MKMLIQKNLLMNIILLSIALGAVKINAAATPAHEEYRPLFMAIEKGNTKQIDEFVDQIKLAKGLQGLRALIDVLKKHEHENPRIHDELQKIEALVADLLACYRRDEKPMPLHVRSIASFEKAFLSSVSQKNEQKANEIIEQMKHHGLIGISKLLNVLGNGGLDPELVSKLMPRVTNIKEELQKKELSPVQIEQCKIDLEQVTQTLKTALEKAGVRPDLRGKECIFFANLLDGNRLWKGVNVYRRDPDKRIQGCYSSDTQQVDPNCMKNKVAHYKIHLMPMDEDLIKIVVDLTKFAQENHAFATLIYNAKFFTDMVENPLYAKEIMEKDFPRIVLYVAGGKEEAQKALNYLYYRYYQIPGLDKAPRYNQKVTSLICFAQGNGDDKEEPYFEKYYEQPNMIYYVPDITGENQDYHLVHPLTKERL